MPARHNKFVKNNHREHRSKKGRQQFSAKRRVSKMILEQKRRKDKKYDIDDDAAHLNFGFQ